MGPHRATLLWSSAQIYATSFHYCAPAGCPPEEVASFLVPSFFVLRRLRRLLRPTLLQRVEVSVLASPVAQPAQRGDWREMNASVVESPADKRSRFRVGSIGPASPPVSFG